MVHVNVPAAIEQSASDSLPVVPTGIGSLTTTPATTVDGPLFVSVIVYVVEVPATTEATTVGLREAMRSAAGSTIVLCEPVLLARLGSNVVDVDVGRVGVEPTRGAVSRETETVIVQVAPEGSEPNVHVTSFPTVCTPRTRMCTGDGSPARRNRVGHLEVSASDGPLFVTTIV